MGSHGDIVFKDVICKKKNLIDDLQIIARGTQSRMKGMGSALI
jgi:hypothetical protein